MRDENRAAKIAEGGQGPSWIVVASWASVVVWACLIFFVSSRTGAGLNDGMGVFSEIFRALKQWQAATFGPGADVVNPVAHFCEYTVFGALLTNALRRHMSLGRAALVGLACASCYAVTDEFHQYFVPGRACDPVDWLVDTCGAALGAFIASSALRRRARRR